MFTKSMIFTLRKFCEGAHAFDGGFLLIVTLELDLTINVGIVKSLEERRRAFFMNIDSTDSICNRVKNGRVILTQESESIMAWL